MTVGELLTLRIEGLGTGGEGVGRQEGRVVFVPGAYPGDLVRVAVEEIRPRYLRGRLREVVEPSPDREAPRCPHQGRCGGCPLMGLRYEAGLQLKVQGLVETLQRVGNLGEVPLAPVLGMARPWDYRHKTAYPLGRTPEGPTLGFYATGSHRLVEVASCPVAAPANREARTAIEAALRRRNWKTYDERTGTGELRHVVLRSSHRTGRLLATIVSRGQLPEAAGLGPELAGALPNLEGLFLNLNPKPGNVILGREFQTLWGTDRLDEALGELHFRISPASFFQVNPAMAEVLYGVVAEEAALTGVEGLLDLYSGTGTIALWLAAKAGRVVGVEEVPAAVADARENARRNGLTAEFRAGATEEVLKELSATGWRPEVVTLDPPRAGLAPGVVEALAVLRPARVVYVSCWPATLARDLARFTTVGYRVRSIRPVDLFPHTAHLETVVTLVPG